MEQKGLIALGIPTHKRPDRAIKSIQNALSLNIYDQIIVSANSHEPKLDAFIEGLDRKEITYHKQNNNVGMSLNYAEVIGLCDCKYLHIVSDEDSINENNMELLHSKLSRSDEISVIVLSVLGQDGKLYKDATWQKNTTLDDVCGNTGHIGSSIINVATWNSKHFKKMDSYCRRKGDVYPTTAAAVISYSIGEKLLYFPEHILEMGEPHHESEMGGYHIYGFEPRLIQYVSMFSLLDSLKLKNKIKVYIYFLKFFSHHALCGAMRMYPDEKPIYTCKKVIKNNILTGKERNAVYVVMLAYYCFKFAYLVRRLLKFFRVI